MAYQIIKDEYYNPGGFFGSYGIRYDPETGDYVLSQKSAAGYTIGIGLATLIKNGSYTSDAVQIPELFKDGNVNDPTDKAKNMLKEVNNFAYQAYRTIGASNKGSKINSAALPENQGRFVVNNYAADANPGIASAIPLLSNPPGQGNPFFGYLNIDDKQFNSSNMGRLFPSSKILKYPSDIIENRQDILKITQYEYKAPYGDIFKSKNAKELFTKGAQRQSALKKALSSVILPIPNNIADSNGVNWGDGDQINSTSLAAVGNIQKVTAAVTAGKFSKYVANIAGYGQVADILGSDALANIIALSSMGGLDNPTTGAALQSLILKKAGFDISPETILARGYGVVANSNLELLFSGPTLRNFQFGYILSPRSEKEAIICKNIIRYFKQGMAAKKSNVSGGGAGASSFLLSTPNVFKLEYKTFDEQGKPKNNPGLNKFKICALSNFQVSYADGQWSAYDKGQPVRYQIAFNFKELEPIYENDYQDTISNKLIGNINGKYIDQPPVFDDEIGF